MYREVSLIKDDLLYSHSHPIPCATEFLGRGSLVDMLPHWIENWKSQLGLHRP